MTVERHIRLRFADGRTLAVTTDDIALLLEYLEAPTATRQQIASQLQRLLDQSRTGAVMAPQAVTCPRPWGSYVVLPRTFAKWLTDAMTLSDSELNTVCGRLNHWLAGDSETACRATESVGVTGDGKP